MKECKKCNLQKEEISFCKSSRYKDKLHIYCKDCISLDNKNYRLNNSLKESLRKKEYRELKKLKPVKHYVYLLPNENYVGTTKNIPERMSKHRTKNNRNVDDYRILATFDDRSDALELEALLHTIGYLGKHKNNMYK